VSDTSSGDEPRPDGEQQAEEAAVESAASIDESGELNLADVPEARIEADLDAREAAIGPRKAMGPPLDDDEDDDQPGAVTLDEPDGAELTPMGQQEGPGQ